MTLDKFEYVMAIAEEKNITKAAKKLYITQPGLTAYINKLEQYLGIKIFDRSVTPIQVTEAGKLYIRKMKEIQKEEALLRLSLHNLGSPKSIFRIGMGSSRGMQWLPILLPAFQERYPDVSLSVIEDGIPELENSVSKGRIDVAFGALSTSYSDICYEPVRKERIYCIVPRRFPAFAEWPLEKGTLTCPEEIVPQQLDGIPFILPSPYNGFYQFTEQLMRQQQICPSDTLSLSNMDTAYQLAGKGCGAIFINAADYDRVHPEMRDQLAFCTLKGVSIIRQSMMGYKEDNQNLDMIGVLKEIIKDKLLPELGEYE